MKDTVKMLKMATKIRSQRAKIKRLENENSELRGKLKRKTYIAGPMTGYENYNFDRFYEVERNLNRLGIETVNPARITDENGGQDAFVSDENRRNGILSIQQKLIREECSRILLLKGWEKSSGVKKELSTAIENGLEIVLLSDVPQDNTDYGDHCEHRENA